MDSNIIQVFTLFMKAIFSQVRHPSHPGRGHASLTCHMTQFERSDWLRSENFTNIMTEYDIDTVCELPQKSLDLLTGSCQVELKMEMDLSLMGAL